MSETTEKLSAWRSFRRAHESQWFLNSAMLRGQQNVDWGLKEQRVNVTPPPPHRVRLNINYIRPKIQARRAIFTRDPTRLDVIPASPDGEDRMNARASGKALQYLWRKQAIDKKKFQALQWSEICGRGYLWLHWDESVMGRVRQVTPLGPEIQTIPIGDITVEPGSPFEVLVADPALPYIGQQPEILRVRLMHMEELKARYPGEAEHIKGGAEGDLFRYAEQMANVNQAGYGGIGIVERAHIKDLQDQALLIEHFIHPSPVHPKGAYRVLIGERTVREEDELPHGLWDLPNPYPVEEFVDLPAPNQYWTSTLVEQLIPLQRELNLYASKVAEHLRLSVNPKIIVYRQHRLPDGAWTDEAGEIITLNAHPGLPPPQVIFPAPISPDITRRIAEIKQEFEDLSQVTASLEGRAGSSKSGLQTSLLQEAAQAVQQPDVSMIHETMVALGQKIRRMMQQYYEVPRLVSSIGRNYEPDVVEFSKANIDEFADIIVNPSSALPPGKAARIASIMEMVDRGLLGNMGEAEDRRRALALMELGSAEDVIDDARTDEALARIENNQIEQGGEIANPDLFENHPAHFRIHTDLLKSPAAHRWPPEQRNRLIFHVIAHMDFMDPQAALTAAQIYQLPALPPNAQRLLQQQQLLQGQPVGGPNANPANRTDNPGNQPAAARAAGVQQPQFAATV